MVFPHPIGILNQKNLWPTLIYQFEHLLHWSGTPYTAYTTYSNPFVFTVCLEMTNRVIDDSSIKDGIDDTVINDMDMDGDYDGGINSDYDGNAGCKVFTCHNGCFWIFLFKK